LLKNEERHKTKLDPKFRGPFLVTEKLEGDRYRLKALTNKRTYKYSHEFLRRLPGKGIATELDDECDDEEITELNGESSDEDATD